MNEITFSIVCVTKCEAPDESEVEYLEQELDRLLSENGFKVKKLDSEVY